VVLEASGRAGGVLGTETFEGALLERGPDTIVTHKPAALDLCRRLGLGDRLVPVAPGPSAVLVGGRLVPLPAGFSIFKGSPRRTLLSTPLLSWRGRMRALGAILKGEAATNDESVASFLRRRFGREYYERLAEPVVAAIHMADLERLSLAAAFPRSPAPARPSTPHPMVTLRDGGLGQLADALVARLPPGALRLKSSAERLLRDDDGLMVEVDGHLLRADSVLLAVPAVAAAALLRDLSPRAALPCASCATVHLAWRRRAVARWPSLHGLFVPRTAGLPFVAATFVSNKFPDRVPDDVLLARAFLGGALHPILPDDDDDLARLAAGALAPLLGAAEPPCWFRVVRHDGAMPQPPVGFVPPRTAPGIEFAGGPLGAYGLPDSIAAAEGAAERVFGAWSDDAGERRPA
jgi:oxygen-dependent protoporphyrinogen oxidase